VDFVFNPARLLPFQDREKQGKNIAKQITQVYHSGLHVQFFTPLLLRLCCFATQRLD